MTQSNPIHLPDEALLSIGHILDEDSENKINFESLSDDQLFIACELVCKSIDISLKLPPQLNEKDSVREAITFIAEFSDIQIRQVKLPKNWWLQDQGNLLVFWQTEKNPCALIYDRDHYYLANPADKTKSIVTEELAKEISPQAFQFYRTLPTHSLTWRDLWRFIKKQSKKQLQQLFLLQLLITGLGLLIPVITGVLFNSVVPYADLGILGQLFIILIINISISSSFFLAQITTTIRWRFKENASLQPAIWDRLLQLPMSFFRQANAGDLTLQSVGIDTIQQSLNTATVTTILSSFVSILSLIILFYLVPFIAFVLLAVTVLIASLILLIFRLQIKPLINATHLQGKISGFLLQLLGNISKIKTSNSEQRLFANWTKKLLEKTQLVFQAGKINLHIVTFNAIAPIIINIILFILVVKQEKSITLGNFITFNSALSELVNSVIALLGMTSVFINIKIAYERAKPILQTTPENKNSGIAQWHLLGNISLEQLTFRYDRSLPFIFRGLSLNIKSGEFIAFVGPSGVGKSTLFRLLLGLEKPESGNIFYDGIGLAKLNPRNVRKQLGVVLQNSYLMPGSIYENIAGNSNLTLEEIWQLLALVDLHEDIASLPMNVHTVLMENGKTLSAGQRQRLLLARALAHKPRILLLDEATSALDNVTQAKIHTNLNQLNITRIAVAHRLSTITHADHIYVFNQGEIVQTGNYETLINQPGLFQELSKQQLY